MNTTKTIIKPRRKALHNPRATDAAPCTCPACVRHRTEEGKALADGWNGYARSTGARFAIILTGDAMKPRFLPGDTLAIDGDRKPQPGDAVLAIFDGNPIKKGVMQLNGDGDLTDLRGGYVPRGCFTVEGVIIGRHPAPRV